MPFIRTAMPKGIEKSRKKLIVKGIHEALVEGIGMPKDELFNLVSEYGDGEFFYDRSFNGIARRATYIHESDTAFGLFTKYYQPLQECYRHFWKEVKPYAFRQFELLRHS